MQVLLRWATRRRRNALRSARAMCGARAFARCRVSKEKRGFGPVFYFARSTSLIKWGGFRQQRDKIAQPARNARPPHCEPVNNAGADIDRPEQPVHHAEVCAALQGTRGN